MHAGGSDFIHGNKHSKKTTAATQQAIAWMTDYFETFTDKMPKADRAQVWHLSSGMNKTDVFALYEQWCLDTETEPISSNYFNAVWNRDFEHVKIPENNRFKQCDM